MIIPVLHRQPDWLLIHKPAGIAVQNQADQTGLLPLLRQQLNDQPLWLVHRLDKITSGLLLLATTSEAAARLSDLFAKRQIDKYYLALSDKKPKKKQGQVTGDMQKRRDGVWCLTRSMQNPASSEFFSHAVMPNQRGFLIKPTTGKTHQIRVALKSLGSPILGDSPYKGSAADRTYLHAYALCFHDLGQTYQFVCPPDSGEHFTSDVFIDWLRRYPAPWQANWRMRTLNHAQ